MAKLFFWVFLVGLFLTVDCFFFSNLNILSPYEQCFALLNLAYKIQKKKKFERCLLKIMFEIQG